MVMYIQFYKQALYLYLTSDAIKKKTFVLKKKKNMFFFAKKNLS